MGNSKTKILTRKSNLSIVQFKSCGHIGLMYKNLLLKFNPSGFMEFSSSFEKLDFEQQALRFPDGTARLVMNTSQREIQLCFELDEYQKVSQALKEAAMMLEVNQILYSE